jgi:hypothetical protein
MIHTPDPAPGGPPVGADVVPLLPVPQQLAHLFGGAYSAQWYVRKHKARLVGAGALLMHCGRWYVDLTRFDAAFREISADAARAQLAREAA